MARASCIVLCLLTQVPLSLSHRDKLVHFFKFPLSILLLHNHFALFYMTHNVEKHERLILQTVLCYLYICLQRNIIS